MSTFYEENLDVLQNLESGIIEVYRADRTLIDIDVKDALDALVRHYHAQEEQRTPPVLRLGERAHRVFDSVRQVCEWRLRGGEDLETDERIPLELLIACLRKIGKSVVLWTKEGGRKGYLDFVDSHMV